MIKKIAAGILACSIMAAPLQAFETSLFDSSSMTRKLIQGIASVGLFAACAELGLGGLNKTKLYLNSERTEVGERVPRFLVEGVSRLVGAGLLGWLGWKMNVSAWNR